MASGMLCCDQQCGMLSALAVRTPSTTGGCSQLQRVRAPRHLPQLPRPPLPMLLLQLRSTRVLSSAWCAAR